SERSAGTDDGRAGEGERTDGENEVGEPDAVGTDDEQSEIAGGGNDFDGADLQLTPPEPFGRGNQLSLFDLIPTEAEQITYIDKAESEPKTPFAFSFSQEEIDTVLRFGSNTDDHRKRIVAEFMKQKSLDENADFLKRMYHGGNGFIVDNRDICAWYADDGIHLAQGRSASHTTFAKVLDWEEAAERVGQMLEDGTFASNVELVEAVSYAQHLLAVDIWNLHSYFSEEAHGKYYSTVMFDGTYPDSVDRITEMLADPFMRDVIAEETARLAGDYAQNRNLLRFHHARPDHLAVRIRELGDMTHEYAAELTELPEVRRFVTEDEIAESFIRHGSGIYNGKHRIYDYLIGNHTDKEKIDFLKNEYGTGGHSHALSGSTGSWEDHDSKGIRLKKSGCADVEISWTNVLKRLNDLIYKDRYLTPEEKDTVLLRYAESAEETVEIPDSPVEEPAETSELVRVPETVAIYPAEENHLPYDVVIQTIRTDEPKEIPPENFRITDDDLGTGGAKAKYHMNMDAINTLKQIESENRHATPEEQEVLSKYVGWGGLADAFDDFKENWQKEYTELSAVLTPEEYTAARSSTLNAHYTSPTVIKAIYEAVGNMGFQTGNILEPAMGVGNFFGLLPEEMAGSKLYGVELDSITGRIAKQLYPNADITVAGFETTDRRDFFDLAVGNVPFGNYKVNDRAYNKLGFSIHDYFFAKTLDQVRPGGVIAFVTSRYTMDKQSTEVRKYIAERADLLGAIRLPNNAFKANAGTDVVSDILFLQKRDRPQVIEPDWVHLSQNMDGFSINSYFIDHPEMILGRQSAENTQYGKQDFTVEPLPDVSLADQLHEVIKHIGGQYKEAELPDLGDNEAIDKTLPADPNVKNYSYTVVDGEVYYRENSIMVQPNLNATAQERVKGMVELRDCVHDLIDKQLYGAGEIEITQIQNRLNQLYDDFTTKYGLINDRPNRAAFAEDSSYYLLCSLEILDEDHKLKRKADMFTKRTIMPNTVVTSVDTAAEALAVSIAEKAKVDMPYMSELTGKSAEELVADLRGVIFQIPEPAKSDGSVRYVTADEYLSGNVREKLRIAEAFAADNPAFAVNVEALKA
ncbi:MAG: N-6 DNA methylase, partial [Clostridia bacterium]|nr:N-6 DNA methylase [Clostridia bacterium]